MNRRQEVEHALAEWRRAQRQLEALTPDDPEWDDAVDEAVAARETYTELVRSTAPARAIPATVEVTIRPASG